MIVARLSHQQKIALVSLFTFVARADGRLDEHEWHYLNRFCEEHGLTYDINEEPVLSDVCSVFDTPQSAMIALMETVKMALSDFYYDSNEQALVKEIAGLMQIPHEQYEAFDLWAMAGYHWARRGRELLISVEGL